MMSGALLIKPPGARMIRLGLTLPIAGLDLRRSVEMAVRAEQLGYDDLWTTEVMSHDAFALHAAVAARTSTVRLGIGLVSAFTRAPGTIAMAAATLQQISGGRAVLGIGASNRRLVEDGLGGRYQRPVEYIRELVEVLQLMTTGERIEYRGERIEVAGFKLGLGPTETPIMLGALGPRMVRLVGEVADGLLTHLVTAEALDDALVQVRAGAREAGRDPATEVVCRVPVVIGEGDRATDLMFTRYLMSYVYDPAYRASLKRQGFADSLAGFDAARKSEDRVGAAAEAGGQLRRAFAAVGPLEVVMARLGEYASHGATALVIAPASAAPDRRERELEIVRTIEEIASRRSDLDAT